MSAATMYSTTVPIKSPRYSSFYFVNYHIIFCYFISYSSPFFPLFLQLPSLFYLSTQSLTTPPIFITPEAITWLSFYSIIPSFSLLLHPWSGGTVTHFTFETSFLHHHISNFLPPNSLSHYTTFSHFYHHFYRLHYSFSNSTLPITDSNLPLIDSSLQ